MSYTYKDFAAGIVANARSSGGTTLAVDDGSSFGAAMSPSAPMPLVVYDGDTFKTLLSCTGRTGDTLTIAGTLGGYDDLAVSAGWRVGCVANAHALNSLWAAVGPLADDPVTKTYVDAALLGKANATTVTALVGRVDDIEADYTTSSELAAGLADKASTTTTDALDARLDALEAAPKPIVPLARWILASSADLATSDAPEELADVPAGYSLHAVRVNAATNPSGGGFSFNVTANGTDIFSSAQAHPANSTTSAAYGGFATTSVAAGDLIGLSLASAGTGVRHVVITLYGREAS